jgi:hypothetical protein
MNPSFIHIKNRMDVFLFDNLLLGNEYYYRWDIHYLFCKSDRNDNNIIIFNDI